MAFKLFCVSSLWSFLYNPQDFCSDQMRIKLTVQSELLLFLSLFPTPIPVCALSLCTPLCRQGQPVYPITTGGFRHPYPTALTVNASMSRWVPSTGPSTKAMVNFRKVLYVATRPSTSRAADTMWIEWYKTHRALHFLSKKMLKNYPELPR